MRIEASVGEVVDKLTILEIKLERIKTPAKLRNLRSEYDLLRKSFEEEGIAVDPADISELKAVNTNLWEIEDRLRLKHRHGEFDREFVELAKSVYFENDKRFEIKTRINRKSGSKIVEEKDYVDYGKPDRP
jgi:hypothetical protein